MSPGSRCGLLVWAVVCAAVATASAAMQERRAVPLVDHHQHLLSPAGAVLVNRELRRDERPVTSPDLVEMLDDAGIGRAVVVSNAYYFDSPVLNTAGVRDAYANVQAENDWTAQQVARFPKRLVAFCSLNPLRDYALPELDRCSKNPNFKGLKLHFGGSGVELKNKAHVERIQKVFRAANERAFPMIVHVRADQTYGAEHVSIVLNQILSAAPDVTIQIAHLWGGENYSDGALAAYADAIAARHPAARNLYFDVAELARVLSGRKDVLQRVVALMRRIGMDRIVYGSDGPVYGNWQPRGAWSAFSREVPLTDEEFSAIANNVAPYLR